MDSEHNYHHRSIRLKDYDYSQEGAYFITICANHRASIFGEIEEQSIRLNKRGRIVEAEWLKTGAMRKPDRACATCPYRKFGKPRSGELPTIIRLFKSSVSRQIDNNSQAVFNPVWQKIIMNMSSAMKNL